MSSRYTSARLLIALVVCLAVATGACAATADCTLSFLTTKANAQQPRRWVCPLYTDRPTSGLHAGDELYAVGSAAWYYASDATTWVLNIGATGLTGPGYAATSTTSVTLGTGTKTFTTQTGLADPAGDRARVSKDAANYLEGPVASYSGTTLVVTSDRIVGSGTYTAWNIGLAGDLGATGASGSNGSNGYDTLVATA